RRRNARRAGASLGPVAPKVLGAWSEAQRTSEGFEMARTALNQTVATNRILHGDALTLLECCPADVIDCIVTSPPYWQQRDYRGASVQVGREATPADYV